MRKAIWIVMPTNRFAIKDASAFTNTLCNKSTGCSQVLELIAYDKLEHDANVEALLSQYDREVTQTKRARLNELQHTATTHT